MSVQPQLPAMSIRPPAFISSEEDRRRFVRASVNWLYYRGDIYEATSGWSAHGAGRYLYQRIRSIVQSVAYVADRNVDAVEGGDEGFSISVPRSGSRWKSINEAIDRILDFNDFHSLRFVLTQHGVLSGHVVVGLQFMEDDGVTGWPNVYFTNIDSRCYFPRFSPGRPSLRPFIEAVDICWEELDGTTRRQMRESFDAVSIQRHVDDEAVGQPEEHDLGLVPFVDWKQSPSAGYFGEDALRRMWEGADAQNELFSLMYTVARRTAMPRWTVNAPAPARRADSSPSMSEQPRQAPFEMGDETESSILWLGSRDATIQRLNDDPRFSEFVTFMDKLESSIRDHCPEYDLETVKGLGSNISGYAVRLILGPFFRKVSRLRSATDEGVRNLFFAALRILAHRGVIDLPEDFRASDIRITRDPIDQEHPGELLERWIRAYKEGLVSGRTAALRSGLVRSEQEWRTERQFIEENSSGGHV